ncbi:MAG: M48 family metallopeptidase [Betaproteobacteria bacterium]|nr:M48 family metallopeptidase [Betaproteobacteria bacterium]
MDFFAAQAQAHRKSRWLVLWFILAVTSIIALVYLSLAVVLQSTEKTLATLWNGELFFWVCLLVGGGIAAASLYKIWQISRQGGMFIAQQLGGRMVTRDTNDPAEKRLLNVIDEMAIAAGIPAPVAFVLTEESSLNAFAAGLTTRDCVIGVTQGLLKTMNRDELQGVIAHEISHIVNGDSRLNVKLIGVLFGIYVITIVGRGFMRARGRNVGGVILIGLLLCVVGSVGLFFGRLIQAAVSRQREYLADASATQFTRYPAGLSSALRKLQNASSAILHPEAGAASHLFFGESSTSWFKFATHPPLAERIRRLGGILLHQPDKGETFPSASTAAFGENAQPVPILAANPHAAMPILPAALLLESKNAPEEESLTQAQFLLASLPKDLRQKANSIVGATGILGGLLFANQSDIRAQQEKLLPPDALPVAQELYQWFSSRMEGERYQLVPPDARPTEQELYQRLSMQPEEVARYRLVWFDLILPTLREALEAERQQLLVMAKGLIRADGRVSPTEFALYTLLRGALLSPAERRVKRSELRLEQLDKDIADLLALLAYAGHDDMEMVEAAYREAITCSPANVKHPLPAKTGLSLNKISQALAHLALAAPPYRKKLLYACEVVVRHDGKITPVENELLRAIKQSLDCPTPLAYN